ncbi:hypothetical protein FWK35_00032555 [Aphis craccivora]|uniref:Uncharacterized protein n=1 Tax=Aphis craccivora TaxID=307492 RepID=A0A6G0Z996_APHCR|nr:hypothetical protein FWK35_00032555 [Aphis craccivora]
MICQNAKKSG